MGIAITPSNLNFLVFLGAPQGSILCSLFFLVYINKLSNHRVSTVKHLAADAILFFIAHNAKTSGDGLNSGLKGNLNGHPYWKMSFNPDLN